MFFGRSFVQKVVRFTVPFQPHTLGAPYRRPSNISSTVTSNANRHPNQLSMVLKDHGDDILKPDESDMETRETTRDT